MYHVYVNSMEMHIRESWGPKYFLAEFRLTFLYYLKLILDSQETYE